MDIAAGDRLQLKFNGRSAEGAPISNGELVTVRHVAADGGLVVESDAGTTKTLTPQQRLFNRGYAVTSYAAQGKTVETVLVADAGCKAATSRNQWYVAISRARRKAIIEVVPESWTGRIVNPKTEERSTCQRNDVSTVPI
jgi:ATP-dependent exoDNAse (exonuclease V) alpha subunit